MNDTKAPKTTDQSDDDGDDLGVSIDDRSEVLSQLRSGFLSRYQDSDISSNLVKAAERFDDDPVLRTHIYIYLCASACEEGKFEECEDFGYKALASVKKYPHETKQLREPGIDTLYNRLALTASLQRNMVAYRHFSVMQLLAISDRDESDNFELTSISVALRNIADAELMLGRTARAAAIYTLAVWHPIISPRSAANHCEIYAEILAADGRLPEAIGAAQEAVDLARNEPVYRSTTRLAWTLMQLATSAGDFHRAHEAWNDIVETRRITNKTNPLDTVARAHLAYSEGEPELALELLNQAEPDLDPTYDKRGRHLALLIRSQIAFRDQNLDEAHRLLDLIEQDSIDYRVAKEIAELRLDLYRVSGNKHGVLREMRRLQVLASQPTKTNMLSTEVDDQSIDEILIRCHSQLLQTLTKQYAWVVAMVAHDVRSALAVTQMAVLHLDADLERASTILNHSVESIVTIVDLLSVCANLDHGLVSVHRERITLVDLISTTLHTTELLAQEKEQTFTVELGDIGGLELETDRSLFSMALSNLTHNAVKYTGPGGRVGLTAALHPESGRLNLVVSDNGQGLGPDEKERIFDRYTLGSASPTGGESRLGLGLHLSQRLAALIGGSVSAHSRGQGHGSEFTLSIFRTESLPQ